MKSEIFYRKNMKRTKIIKMDTCNRKNLIICITVIGSLFFSPIELPILKTQFYTPPFSTIFVS